MSGSRGASGRKPKAKAFILIGFMGAGKGSVGRALGKKLGWAFEDLDERIERCEQRTVPEIFRESGEAEFRRAESAALKEMLHQARREPKKILALGGGAFAQKQNVRLIADAKIPTVFLDAPAEELWERCKRQAKQQSIERPLLGTLESFCDLYAARRPHYLRASDRIETGGKTVEEVAAEVVQALGLNKGGGKK